MQFQVPINIKPLVPSITYQDKILLIGSCFTEHIGNYMAEVKFDTLQNPNGILFDPISVCNSLISYIDKKQYKEEDLFYLNECWHSWNHHSRFSGLDKNEVIHSINCSQQEAHTFLQKADWLFVTLGSSFVYNLVENGQPVANCHKAPAQTFQKHLSTIEQTVSALDTTIHRLMAFNPGLKIIFTVSPVRHIRDGVVDNNRSKARLIEAVHHLVNKFEGLYYFPAYELVIDVLRDYRFYDIDLAHPNYAATQFVLEQFAQSCLNEETRSLMDQIQSIVTARKHKPFNPTSQQHKQFLQNTLQKIEELQKKYSFINMKDEITYFDKSLN